MISVGISGAPGRMGLLAQAAVEPSEDLVIGGLYAPGHDGEPLAAGTCSGDPEALRGCDVILELTHPEAAPSNVSRWKSFGAHVVIGTSGYGSSRIARLLDEWAGSDRRCLVVPNFSVGAVLMMRFSELAAPFFAAVEIIEMHHDRKRDAPSGTALNTAARMGRIRREAGIRPTDRGRELEAGALGAEVEGVPVHSVRSAGLLAHQEVILGGVGEYLTICHDTTDLASFAAGIVLALRSVASLEEPVTVGLDGLLGL